MDRLITALKNVLAEVTKQTINSFAKKLESEYGVVLQIYLKEFKDYDEAGIVIASIVVPKEVRGQGVGSAVMEKITDFADENTLIIALTPSKDFGATSITRLRKFYGKFGFKRNLGRNKDYRFQEAMIRNP